MLAAAVVEQVTVVVLVVVVVVLVVEVLAQITMVLLELRVLPILAAAVALVHTYQDQMVVLVAQALLLLDIRRHRKKYGN
jgi:hypothetical protein